MTPHLPAVLEPGADYAGSLPDVASLPVAIYIRDACWIFEIDLEARNAAAGAEAALPGQILIGDAGDGLGAAAATIASALRAAGNSASAVRFVGVVDDFIALSASGAYAGGALPRHARQPTPAAGRHQAPA